MTMKPSIKSWSWWRPLDIVLVKNKLCVGVIAIVVVVTSLSLIWLFFKKFKPKKPEHAFFFFVVVVDVVDVVCRSRVRPAIACGLEKGL